MCEPVSLAIAMGGMGLASGLMSARQQAKAEGAAEDTKRRQQIEMIRQMNMSNADSNLEARDKYDQAQQQLTEINLKSLRNRGMLTAAIGESGIAGNSMDRIKRVSQAESDRERVGVMDNYQRDYQTIFANQVGAVENTKSQLKGMAPVLKTSKLAQALNVASSTMNGAAQGYGMGQDIKAAKGGS